MLEHLKGLKDQKMLAILKGDRFFIESVLLNINSLCYGQYQMSSVIMKAGLKNTITLSWPGPADYK